MVKKRGRQGYRSFTVLSISRKGGCQTKGNGGRFINKTAAGAARKAFTDLCRTKRIRGVCTLFVTMRETSQGSKKKMYSYKLQRNRLAKPLIMQEGTDNEYVIEYNSTIKSQKNPTSCTKENKKDRPQTRGRQKKRTAKKTRMAANNVRRMSNNRPKRSATKKSKKSPSARPVRRSKRLAAKK